MMVLAFNSYSFKRDGDPYKKKFDSEISGLNQLSCYFKNMNQTMAGIIVENIYR